MVLSGITTISFTKLSMNALRSVNPLRQRTSGPLQWQRTLCKTASLKGMFLDRHKAERDIPGSARTPPGVSVTPPAWSFCVP